jgi:hypothetical protein
MKPWQPKKKNENLEAYCTKLVREILHSNNICFRNHDIDIKIVPPSRGRVRILFDGKRSEYLEGKVLARLDRTESVPQMEWFDTFNRDMAVREVV